MYGGTLLSFGHQQELGNTLNSDNLFSFYWLVIFAGTFLTLGIFRFLWPLYYFYQHRFFVEKITQETPNTWSVFIRGTNLQNFKVRAGQFFIARFFAKGYFLEAHPFSLSEEPNPDYLRLTIKASGDFTAKVAQIPLGTKVYLEGPYGIFTADNSSVDIYLAPQYTFVSTTKGIYDRIDNKVSIDLREFPGGGFGTAEVTAKATAKSGDLDQAVSQAALRTPKVTLKVSDVDEYVGGNSSSNSVLGASAAGAGFLPHSIIGWLILLIVLAAIVIIGRRYFIKKDY
jgi:hypothetical protein